MALYQQDITPKPRNLAEAAGLWADGAPVRQPRPLSPLVERALQQQQQQQQQQEAAPPRAPARTILEAAGISRPEVALRPISPLVQRMREQEAARAASAGSAVDQIPTGGQRAAPLPDGSQSDPLNSEVGRNVMNTMAALPGTTGLAARAGWTAGAAKGAGGALSTERVIPAAWEVVQDGGSLARAAEGGGVLSRAANLATQQAALPGATGELLPAIAANPFVRRALAEAAPQMARNARGPVPWADVVPPAALGGTQGSQALGGIARSNPLLRYAAMAAGAGGALTAATALDGQGGESGAPVGAVQAAQVPRQGLAAAALAQAASRSPGGGANVVRDGNSYSGPANISGDISINGAQPQGSVTTLPAGATPSGFGGPLVQAAGIVPWGSDRPGFSIMDNPLVARALGGVSGQNMVAADGLAARSQLESMARLRASGQIASPAPGPSMSLSGGALGIRRDPSIVASELGAQRGFDRAVGRDPASLQRGAALTKTAMEQQGETQRQLISSGATLQAAGLKAAAGRAAPAGYRYTANGALEAIPGGPASSKLAEEQKTRDAALDGSRQAIGTINRLLSSPGREGATGTWNLSRHIPGNASADFAAEVETLKAQTFLPMVQQLRGMGALSNAEGDKLNAAVGALNFNMSEQAFAESLGRIRDQIASAMQRSGVDINDVANWGLAAPSSAAQQPTTQPQTVSAPAISTARTVTRTGVIDGRRVAQYSDGSVDYAD
ncbi:hypothetical protein [Delftia acidovorans]|uniref:hypothetical protein n=1 Tax=Delftia acidovorans TaxID=80866 RepID=UPI002FDD9899